MVANDATARQADGGGGSSSSEPWKTIVDQVPVGAVLAARSAEGEIEYVNREFTELTGYTLEDVPTVEDWLRLAYPDETYRAYVISNWQRDVDPDRMRRDVTYEVTCKDGTRKHLLLRGSALGGRRMIVTMVDMTRQREAEEALRKSEARYRTLVETCPVPLTLSRDGRLVFMNAAALQLFGVASAEEAVGRKTIDFVHPDYRELMAPARTEADERGVSGVAYYKMLRLDGTELEVEAVAVAAELDGVPAYLAAFHDVTQRNEAQRRRRAYEQKLQDAQRVESLGLLAAGVAHDFNNILMGILGSASLALAGTPDETTRKHLERIDSASRRAAELATQMLACSGQASAPHEGLDVFELTTEMEPLLQAMTRDAASVSIEAPACPTFAMTSATQLRQVMLNLVANAAEAMRGTESRDDEPTVVIRFSQQDARDGEPLLAHGRLEPGRYLVIDVQDRGPGIPPETLRRIFDPFFTTKPSGRGLGLAALHGIVRASRGAVEVESEIGRGTTFRVWLPVAPEARRPRPGSIPPPRLQKARGVVLVVDDEELVRRVTSGMLRRMGFSTLEASSADEGAAVFAAHASEIVLVIVDMNMPGGGVRARDAIHAVRSDMPVVLMSGYREPQLAGTSSDEGFAAFLAKPFDTRAFRKLVGRVLGDGLGDGGSS